MNEAEWQTRKKRIDARLRSCSPPWKILHYKDGMDFSKLDGVAVEELPTANGPADYALFVQGKALA
jgi:type I restriction enzyme R subunit